MFHRLSSLPKSLPRENRADGSWQDTSQHNNGPQADGTPCIVIWPSYLEVGGYLGTAELELLDDVGDLFESMRVPSSVSLRVRDHEERRLLEEQHLN